ncbi:Transcription factor bHLH36 [Musa troglodytarum]|uniref:Transcription factor bHLH36 n=1 Tax=Musa troglodytarum TaxID=320322 RepID=A0A9E7E9P6_9LILI|nr:Transcription factor bHLH36 [Musa troglodytarum]
MKAGAGVEGAKIERRTVERNRRICMKNLCLELTSLIPTDTTMPKRAMRDQDQLDQAFNYIKVLRGRVEKLKQKKEMRSATAELHFVLVEVRSMDSTLLVSFVSGSRSSYMFRKVIGVLEEEGAEVTSASFNLVGGRIFHTIHCQAFCPRIGLEPSSVNERLKKLAG